MMFPAEGRLLKAVCLDKECQAVLHVIPAERTVECHQCGQKFHKDLLQGLQEVPSGEVLPSFCRKLLIANRINGKRGPEMVKVLGLSNYYCKLLSPLLTRYGFDKSTNRAKLLTEMNQGEIFDCSTFADRSFLIEPEHISIAGFGKDITGSIVYLSETLKLIVASNGGEERLIPIHADGDGHCLVHAISRALVGRELFWHPLRSCLKKHFENNIENYKELFKDFIDIDEWACIIQECDPNFKPPDGELHGLRNIHIFGLANVLRRPIILLDSLDCMQKCGDYSALFLPGFVSPEACRGKDNILNKPLCIAWSSPSHNHYIPLVGIQRLPLPVLPASLIPKVWGMPQSQIYQYIEFDSKGNCVIGGNRVLSSGYIQRLAHAMEILFYEINGIHPTLVADYKFYYCSDIMLLNVKTSAIIEMTKTIAQESRLYRCLYCWALNEYRLDITPKEFENICQSLRRHPYQSIPFEGYIFKYDKTRGEAKIEWSQSQKKCCDFCSYNIVRRVTTDGTVIYKAEDKDSPEKPTWYCDQVKKFYPEESFSSKAKYSKDDVDSHKLSLKLHWNDKDVDEKFSFEFPASNRENLNEFVKELSNEMLKKHFAEESSDFALQSYVSDEIWKELRKCDLHLPFRPITKKQETIKEKAENVSLNDVLPKQPPSELRYIKVVTTNGQQSNLPLPEEGVSYGQIQEMIRTEFSIPVSNQRIKLGFPPKEIRPSGDTNKQMLSLSHGDRLMVEVLRKEDSIDSMLNSNAALDDNLINPIYSKFQNDVLWNMMKVSPENFRRNGTIYKQVSEDNRLHTTMHTNLECFPHKTFCYNPATDSIELCIKPLGHFLISSDIDERIEQVRNGEVVLGFCKCPLLAKLEEMNDAHARRRASSSQSSEEIQGRPLIRKGPGFSVLTSPPDNMDIA